MYLICIYIIIRHIFFHRCVAAVVHFSKHILHLFGFRFLPFSVNRNTSFFICRALTINTSITSVGGVILDVYYIAVFVLRAVLISQY